jgi:hypothetical protein
MMRRMKNVLSEFGSLKCDVLEGSEVPGYY